MLTTMRKGVSSILAKALLLFLVVTFGVWGIGDAVRNSGVSSVATIGDVSITPQVFNDRLQRIKRSMPNLPPELSDSEELKTKALDGMIQQAILTQKAQKIGIEIDQATAAKLIASNPQFLTTEGKFDKNAFLAFLQSNNLSEAGYVDAMRRDTQAALLLDTLGMRQDIRYTALSKALDAAQAQTRTGDIYILSARAIAQPATPDEKTLKDYYNEVKEEYLTPELRTIDYIMIPKAVIEHQLRAELNEETIKERYEIEKASMSSPETRSLTQWLFTKEEDAKQAAKDVLAGKQPASGKKTALKNMTKDALPTDIADAVFSLKENAVSEPIKTGFGWQIFKLDQLTPSQMPSLKDSKQRIVDMLVAEALDEHINTLSGKLEDALSAGDSLQKASTVLGEGATVGTLENVAAETKEASPVRAHALARGFALADGENSGLEPTKEGTLVSVFVRSSTPSAPKKLADIKAELVKRYMEQTHRAAVADRAMEVIAKLRKAKDSQTVAREEKLLRRSLPAISLRSAVEAKGDVAGIPPALQRAIFDTQLGEFTSPVRIENGDFAMIKVTQIAQGQPKTSTPEMLQGMNAALENDLYSQTLAALQKQFPVTINKALLTSDAQAGQ